MKIILTILTLLLSISLFSQDLRIKRINEISYEFNHNIDYDVSIYESRIESQFDKIKKIKINNQKVEILFSEETKKEDILNILSEISIIFNHKNYILI